MRQYGLIGYPLGHSFSQKYFTEKFRREGIEDATYHLFPIENIEKLPSLLQENPNLKGLNVTIPYKIAVLDYLDELDDTAQKIGAVNCIRIQNGKLTGYNTDAYGFEMSLIHFLEETGTKKEGLEALVLGTGGASKAVAYALDRLGIAYRYVTSKPSAEHLGYDDLFSSNTVAELPQLIINTTPLGMAPNTEMSPNIPLKRISPKHLIFDLVYNPAETLLLRQVKLYGAATKNGLEMLHLQADRAWEIWQQ